MLFFFFVFIWFQFEVKQGFLASQESFSGANVSLFEFRQDAEDKTDGQSLELLGNFSFFFSLLFLIFIQEKKNKSSIKRFFLKNQRNQKLKDIK